MRPFSVTTLFVLIAAVAAKPVADYNPFEARQVQCNTCVFDNDCNPGQCCRQTAQGVS